MPTKPFTHLRILNATTTHALSFTNTTLSSMKPTHSLKNTFFLSRSFPFKLKYLALSRPQQRLLSTRSRNHGHRSAAEFRSSGSGLGSKSLVDEEAELSDWVSDVRTSSNLRGMVTSDEEESERSGVRRVVRSRNGGGEESARDGLSVKRKKGEERGLFSKSDSIRRRQGGKEFGNNDRRDRSRSARSGVFDDESDKRRGPFLGRETQFGSDLDVVDDEGYGSRSGRREDQRNVVRRNGMRAGREQNSGFKRDRVGAVKGMKGGTERHSRLKRDHGVAGKGRGGFIENDVSGFDDTEERETLMKGIGDLLSDEDIDDVDEIEGDDADMDNDVRSSFGFEKEVREKSTTINSGNSDSYLSETR